MVLVLERLPVAYSSRILWELDDQMWEFISSEITRSILKQNPVIFGTVKEGIMEVLEERLGSFRSGMVAMMGARTLTFLEFRAL